MRYYYKHKEYKKFLNLKSPLNDENYIEITEEQFKELTYTEPSTIDEAKIAKENQINVLKSKLKATDYKAIKYAEGCLSEEEYAPIKAYRQELRDKINELQSQL